MDVIVINIIQPYATQINKKLPTIQTISLISVWYNVNI